jgi:hypothetical protein
MKTGIVLSLVLLGACYEYTPFNPSDASIGKPVRVQLTNTGTEHVISFVGPHADYLDGNLVTLTDSSFTISLADLGRQNGSEESWNGEPVTVRRTDVSSIGFRQASRGKSAAMTALIAGGAVLVGRAVGGISGTGVTKPGGTGNGQ